MKVVSFNAKHLYIYLIISLVLVLIIPVGGVCFIYRSELTFQPSELINNYVFKFLFPLILFVFTFIVGTILYENVKNSRKTENYQFKLKLFKKLIRNNILNVKTMIEMKVKPHEVKKHDQFILEQLGLIIVIVNELRQWLFNSISSDIDDNELINEIDKLNHELLQYIYRIKKITIVRGNKEEIEIELDALFDCLE